MRPLFDEIRAYVGFGPEDETALRSFSPVARPHFEAIVAEFYAVVRLHEGAAAVLRDEAQVERLRQSLTKWLDELLLGPWDDAYLERRARIGQVHVRVGLAQHYMITAMSRVRASLQRIAAAAYRDHPELDDSVRLAIAKVCDLDLALMLETYRADIIARLHRMEQVEKDALQSRVEGLERSYRQATETAELVMITLDSRFRVIFWNGTASRISGHASDEARGRDLFPLLFGEGATKARAVFEEAAGKGSVEQPLVTRTGHARLVRWRVGRLENPDLDGPAWLLTGIDITEEERLERQARINERLAVAGTLAAGLAHEIRNPLNGASLHITVLERSLMRLPEVPETALESAEVLKTEVKRLSALVSDFLEVARPRPIQRSLCDLNEVVSHVLCLVRPEAEGRCVSLSLERFPFEIPASVDPERLRQAVLNLVKNALEAAGEEGKVVVRVRRVVNEGQIDVEDDGPGLPETSAPVFDAFFTTKERGTGLGLSIVHRIAADHGGSVLYESRPGRTLFTLRLPLDLR